MIDKVISLLYTPVMNQTITFDDFSQNLVSITDLRRNAGSIFDRLPQTGTLTVLRDGKVAGLLVAPIIKKSPKTTLQEDLKKIRQLAGGLKFKIDLTPEQLNEEYDKQYEEMLPR